MAWGDTRRGPARASRGQTVNTSAYTSKLRQAGGGSVSRGIATVNRNADFAKLGQPAPPEYVGMESLGSKGVYTPTTLSGEQMNRLNTEALDTMRSRALSTEASPWLKMQLEKQGVEQAAAADTAAQTAASQVQSARSALARAGGLRGGAAERLASKGAESELMARQNVFRQGMLDRANLNVEEERQKLDLLKGTTAADLSSAQYMTGLDTYNVGAQNQAGQFNVSNRLQDLGNRNQSNQFGYGEMMKGIGARNTADAMRASAPGKPTGGTLGKWGREIGEWGRGGGALGRWGRGISDASKNPLIKW